MAKQKQTTDVHSIRALRSDKAESLAPYIERFAAAKGLKTPNAIATYFGINPNTLLDILDIGQCRSYQSTKAMCDGLRIPIGEQRAFYEKYGGFHLDSHHVIDNLIAGKILFSKALSDLAQLNDKELSELLAPLKTPLSTCKQWMRTGSKDMPAFSKIRLLASAQIFDLTHEQAEKFCEKAGCFLDTKHIIKRLSDEKNSLTFGDAVKGLVTLRYDSVAAFSRDKKIDPETGQRWCKGKIPRQALVTLIDEAGLKGDEAKILLSRGGFYIDAAHINQAFKQSGSHSDFLDAVKSVYGMKDGDFGVDEGTVQRGRPGHARHVTTEIKTFVKEFITAAKFVTAAKQHPDLNICWDTYKHVCARFSGHRDGTQASAMYMRQMEEEHHRQLRQR